MKVNYDVILVKLASMKIFLAAIALLGAVTSSAQTKSYIALGDSVAWGYQPPNSSTRSPGDQGYVKLYADWLGTQQGTRPTLWNLGIPGETAASFFNTSEIGGLLNSNYAILFRRSQADAFRNRVTSERNAGRTITNVTYALGANDLLDLQTEAFLAQPFTQQVGQVETALISASVKIGDAFALIRQQCPSAKITVPGYYNPYGAYPSSANDLISKYAIPRLNSILQQYAKRYQAAFAPTYNSFAGNELEFTWIGENDVHPRDAGYASISQAVIIAKVFVKAGP